MLNVSSQFHEMVARPGRQFTFSFLRNGTDQIRSSQIYSISIQEEVCDGQNLCPGVFNKSSCVAEVSRETGSIWRGSYFDIFCTIDGASDQVSLGRFWVYEVRKVSDDRYELTSYDVPEKFGDKFDVADTSVQSILASIESYSGMQIAGKENLTLEEITEVPEDATYADILGWLAGYDEYSVRADRSGGLELFRFDPPDALYLLPAEDLYPADNLYPGAAKDLSPDVMAEGATISRKNIFLSGYTADDEAVAINSLRCVAGENTYEKGSGYGVEYTNPFMTQEHFDELGFYLDAQFTPLDISWRGNPALQAGDVVLAELKKGEYHLCYIMFQSFQIDGGLKSEIRCYSNEDMQRVVPHSPTMRKIEQAYKGMQALLAEAIDQILGAGNGYMSYLYDEENNWIGLQITDSPVVTSTTKGWRWVYGGLYFSDDGFNSIRKTALTADGYIIGDTIATHTVKTEALEVNASRAVDGTIQNFTFGEDGLHIAMKDDEGNIVSTYQVLYSDSGMRVMRGANATGDPDADSTLIAEGDTVIANNLTAKQYLRVQSESVASRFQQFYASAHDEYNFGVFWEV